jgi:hypothetical protein
MISMNFLPSSVRKCALLGILFFLSYISVRAQDGKAIYSANCATCHALDKQLTGPALRGVEERGPWTNRANLVKWIHNPGAFIPTTPYTQQLVQQYNGQIMPSFPQLGEKEIFAVLDYIKTAPVPGEKGGGGPSDGVNVGQETSGNGELIFGIISIRSGHHCTDPDAGEQQP